MGKLFGTDGVRGVANKELTPELTMKIGRAGAYVLAGQLGRPAKILIGTDTRISADMLEAALAAGLCSVGAEVHRAGVIPSPGMAYLVRHYNMDAGVMISASHNPMPDNGIKFFDRDGYKLSDEVEEEIEALINTDNSEAGIKIPRPTGKEVGRCILCRDAVADYTAFLAGTLSGTSKPLEGMKVVLDCANGACCEAAPAVFAELGAETHLLHWKPDGSNINVNCGSTHLESLQAFMKANEADLGLAFDGDGDRVLCVDDRGEVMDGDAILAICGLALKKKGKLKNNTIVATVMSNMGLQIFCDKEGLKLQRTAVGDRYVIQEMIAGGHILGGEQSGHIILHDYNTTGDGILTGLHLLATLKESTGISKMSELRKIIEALPQVLLGAKLRSRITGDIRENKAIDNAIRELEERLADEGRVLVRASGTEPLIRVMIEGRDETLITQWAEDLVKVIEKELK